MTLTGRKRYRRGWGGTLVLQVEETFDKTTSLHGNIETHEVTQWRDAKTEDVTLEVAA